MGDFGDEILEYPGFFTWLLAADSVRGDGDAIICVTKDDGCGLLIEKEKREDEDEGDVYYLRFNADFVPSASERDRGTHIFVMDYVFKELNIDDTDWLKTIGESLFYRTSARIEGVF